MPLTATADPTRVIQGIVTGIGFLGAGVIMKEGLNISGLTTAASIWASSAIGILCGAGFYLAAIMLALIASATMIWGGWVETVLPSRHAIAVLLRFKPGHRPQQADLEQLADSMGYRLAEGSISMSRDSQGEEWHLVLIATDNRKISIPSISETLERQVFLAGYHLSFARN